MLFFRVAVKYAFLAYLIGIAGCSNGKKHGEPATVAEPETQLVHSEHAGVEPVAPTEPKLHTVDLALSDLPESAGWTINAEVSRKLSAVDIAGKMELDIMVHPIHAGAFMGNTLYDLNVIKQRIEEARLYPATAKIAERYGSRTWDIVSAAAGSQHPVPVFFARVDEAEGESQAISESSGWGGLRTLTRIASCRRLVPDLLARIEQARSLPIVDALANQWGVGTWSVILIVADSAHELATFSERCELVLNADEFKQLSGVSSRWSMLIDAVNSKVVPKDFLTTLVRVLDDPETKELTTMTGCSRETIAVAVAGSNVPPATFYARATACLEDSAVKAASASLGVPLARVLFTVADSSLPVDECLSRLQGRKVND